jgi:hypothetical protein
MFQFDLVCERTPLTQLSQTLVMAGMCVGAFFLSNLADRFGRKTAHVATHLALLAVSLAMPFMPNYAGFAAMKFFIGVFQQVSKLSCQGFCQNCTQHCFSSQRRTIMNDNKRKIVLEPITIWGVFLNFLEMYIFKLLPAPPPTSHPS